MTNAEYMAMPDDDKRYELHEGVLIEQPSAAVIHALIVSLLVMMVGNDIRGQKLGRVFGDNLDYLLGEGIILKPDVSFVAASRVRGRAAELFSLCTGSGR